MPHPKLLAIVTTLLELLGGAAVVFGIALIWIPAALIVAGVGGIALSWRLSK